MPNRFCVSTAYTDEQLRQDRFESEGVETFAQARQVFFKATSLNTVKVAMLFDNLTGKIMEYER